jgi:hypothetical protein
MEGLKSLRRTEESAWTVEALAERMVQAVIGKRSHPEESGMTKKAERRFL